MPTTEVFCVCDRTTLDEKVVNVFGIRSGITVPKFPYDLDIRLCGRIRFDNTEQGPHKLNVTIVPPEGAEQRMLDLGTADISVPGPLSFIVQHMDLGITCPFPVLGEYTFVLWIDEKEVADTKVWVRDGSVPEVRLGGKTPMRGPESRN